ncbi:MAG: hypothetical protein Q7U02_08290 [Desulfosalsimonadaceae bacterium]|nr:hypothetical protein [Desulfosalsimonadaceae bacterium]
MPAIISAIAGMARSYGRKDDQARNMMPNNPMTFVSTQKGFYHAKPHRKRSCKDFSFFWDFPQDAPRPNKRR